MNPRPLLLCGVAAGLIGCSARGTWTEADQLRQDLDTARTELARAVAQRDEARAKLAEADRVRLAGSGDLATDAVLALPRCAGIELDRLSGPADAQPLDDRLYDSVDVFVRPFDGERRFVQIVGALNLRADWLPEPGASGGDEPRTLATKTFGPAELRDAYRSSFMGTHYSFRLALPPGVAPRTGSIAFSAEFLDALSGMPHRASLVKPVPAR